MKKILFSLILFSLVASSCSERIDIHTNPQPAKLVVNAFISTEPSQQTVWLSQSVPYFAGISAVPAVTGASVWINDTLLTENDTARGQYITPPNFSVAEGALARLRVEYDMDGNGIPETFTAEETMPHSVQLEELRILPMMDTSRYVPPFGVAIMFRRNVADECFSGDIFYHGSIGNPINMIRYIGGYGADNIPYGTYREQAIFTFATGGVTTDMGNGDTLFLCPFDTLRIRMNSIPRATLDYVSAAGTEAGGSNPMFGGPPANVPSNIFSENENAIGCFALRNPSRWLSVVLPMNVKTLDDTWIAQDGSGTKIDVKDGTATYANGKNKGEIYFKEVEIDGNIRGFWAQRPGKLIRFEMGSYDQFYDHDMEVEWQREQRGFFN